MLRNPDWKVLLSIAESGEWLLFDDISKIINKGKKKIFLITAKESSNIDDKVEKDLEERYEGRIEIRKIPWLEHNNHMTMLLNCEEKKDKMVWKPLKSIFFIRRLQAPHIEPLLLDSSDSFGVLDTFVTYWSKADAEGARVYYKNKKIKEEKEILLKKCDPDHKCEWEEIT